MKSIITIVLILLAGFTLTGCDDDSHTTKSFVQPPGPDPVAVLEEKVETERRLRVKAEALAAEQSAGKDNWQLAALGLGLFAVLAFLGGTSIGTRGRHHASTRE